MLDEVVEVVEKNTLVAVDDMTLAVDALDDNVASEALDKIIDNIFLKIQ